ncbi:serine/threonine-protein kinase [Streptomyces broussonetiae]|uniref:PQQ-binding-like beta-propeller repeat protein n=1 Tax=Streptomyces broussonetiae TaxID=2686304 RepID=A0A6I6MZ48_9ACTN|nr:serine/threonine-protein kinase [Streptomyces broussonetiae]QHA06108.1 PQQ-binding-like beta-propeller repeat protein [Streptomyces broussonetiae]
MTPQRSTGAGAEAELPEYAGHYPLESCLGSGGMGVVHLARSTSGLKLAVKVVHAEFARDPEFRGRFRQEVAAARRVSGAFTAPVVDADPEAARPWMATLFIPGPTLSEHVKRNGPMPAAQLRRLMAGLAEALRDIHRVGVVHRDLKPSNVLLAEDGPKVIDFGISRPKDSELRTETGKLIGTPPFMAPEQFRRPREVGPAADIFALGSVLVHAATGRGPFDSDSPYVVAYQVVHDEPDLTGVPESLAPLVLRCLAKEPEDRPTPDELMRELRSVAASYDTQAFIPAQRTGDDAPAPEPSGAGPAPGPRGRFGRRAALAAGALVLALGAVLTGLLWPGDGGGPAAGRTTAPATAAKVTAWRAKPPGKGSGMPLCVDGAGTLLCFRSGLAYALDPTHGTLLWRRSVAGERTSGTPAFSGGLLLVPTDGGRRVVALDPASGAPRWQRDMSGPGGMQSTGGMLLVTGADGTVTGLAGASGDTKWHRRVAGQGTPALASYAGDPLAYAASASADGAYTLVSAVDPGSGGTRWQARLKGTLQPIGSQGGSLFLLAVDPATGEANAVVRYTPGSKAVRRVALSVPLMAPQADVRGDAVHLLAAGGSLYALDLGTGKQLWHVETSVSRGSAPVSSAGHVYFTAPDGRLLAFDAHDGSLVGQTPPRLDTNAGEVAGVLPTPLLAGARVCAASPDGTVFGVAARDPAGW